MNRDQRLLLEATRDEGLLLDDSGWDRLMTSMAGYYGGGRNRGDRDITRYEARRPKLFGEFNDGTQVTITRAELTRFRATINPVAVAALRAARDARRAEDRRTDGWCWCSKYRHSGVTNDHSKPFPPLSYHPTEAETDEHYARCRELRTQLHQALRDALNLDEPLPGEQMELFAC